MPVAEFVTAYFILLTEEEGRVEKKVLQQKHSCFNILKNVQV